MAYPFSKGRSDRAVGRTVGGSGGSPDSIMPMPGLEKGVLDPPPSMGDAGPLWDRIDRIYCISLRHRTDRQADAARAFFRVGLTDRVLFHLVDRHPDGCEAGIYAAHADCIRDALAAGARRVAVFEDDVVFERFTPAGLARALDFMETEPDWDLFCFGCMVRGSRPTGWPGVRRIDYQCLAHAYVLNRPFAERLLARPYDGTAYDDRLRALQRGRTFAACPCFAFQSDSATDNDQTPVLNRVRALLGGIRRIQKANEFYHIHRRAVILAHVFILAGLAWWVF